MKLVRDRFPKEHKEFGNYFGKSYGKETADVDPVLLLWMIFPLFYNSKLIPSIRNDRKKINLNIVIYFALFLVALVMNFIFFLQPVQD